MQSTGCAPVVRAFHERREQSEPWPDPWTVASGLRVPAPLGDRVMLAILRETRGGAVAVADEALLAQAARGTELEGIDFSPEGGAAVAALIELRTSGVVGPSDRVVIFNTGAGWLYR